jgi:23S rRNA (pseudouridine1915-N3)-methyltransferase
VRVVLASVSPRARRGGGSGGGKSKLAETDALVAEYLGRLGQPRGWLSAEARVFATEAALLEAAGRGPGMKAGAKGKSKALLVLLDSRGKSLNSEQFAAWMAARRDSGVQEVWLAVGPADGWTYIDSGRQAGNTDTDIDMVLSLGPMTLPHELARVVAAEQIYRAWAIVEGHPYHRGH